MHCQYNCKDFSNSRSDGNFCYFRSHTDVCFFLNMMQRNLLRVAYLLRPLLFSTFVAIAFPKERFRCRQCAIYIYICLTLKSSCFRWRMSLLGARCLGNISKPSIRRLQKSLEDIFFLTRLLYRFTPVCTTVLDSWCREECRYDASIVFLSCTQI